SKQIFKVVTKLTKISLDISMEGRESFASIAFNEEPLHTRCWLLPEGRKARAILFIAHGLGEHSACYDKLVDIFVSKDILVYSHDHYGHGLSPGVPGLVSNMQDIVDPVLSHARQIRSANPGTPIFLMGHSMGGLAAVLCAKAEPGLFRGLLLNAPALGVNPAFAPAWKITVGRWLAYLCPQMVMPFSEMKVEYLTSDEAMREELKNDPLQFSRGVRCASGLAIIDAIESLAEYRADFPFIVLHARPDMLTYYQGSERFFQRAVTEDKEFVSFDNLGHQLHYEVEPYRSQVREAMCNWILSRC
ncbi:hypothetical protein BOX15_Mlig002348g2, partial [Macrostomum lignano]